MNVPFLDLQAHHAPLREEIRRVVDEVIDAGAFSGGPFVERFENDFAAYCGTRHAIAVGSGTEALWLSLLACGIGAGDEVITVPMSFFATAEAISLCGARPVFVDIDERTYTMNPEALENALTRRTKAIIPVHLFGQPADMDPILEFARKHGLLVIEDAAQAHGAEYNGRKAGSLADAGCFSFYPAKNLGALGEGGAVTTGDPEMARKIRMFRDHGQTRKNHHAAVGMNGRMDGIQAAVLSLKLLHLDANNQLRREHAGRYEKALAGLDGIILPQPARHALHGYHLYVIQTPRRDELTGHFDRKGIGHGVHYPVPVHLQEAYEYLGHRRGEFPVCERCADRFVSLPMFPEMSPGQIAAVADAVLSNFQTTASRLDQPSPLPH